MTNFLFQGAEDENNDHCDSQNKSDAKINFEIAGLEVEIKPGNDFDEEQFDFVMGFLKEVMGHVACYIWDHCY